MWKWILIVALVVLAPTFVINTFTSGVTFVSAKGRELVGEVVREGSKAVQESASTAKESVPVIDRSFK